MERPDLASLVTLSSNRSFAFERNQIPLTPIAAMNKFRMLQSDRFRREVSAGNQD
jgi:hypothetical protein